jgi:primosomal protein N' (replication factor Y)
MRHARERCKECHSWRLEAFGIGTELVEREINKGLPDRKTFVLSSDTAKTHKQTKTLIEAFYATPGSILIGTELAIPYLHTALPLTAVVSLDSLLSLPSWNMYERITSTLTRIREATELECIVQTRRPEADVLRMALEGNFSSLYKNELRTRKQLGYPPYTTIIKITATGTETHVTDRIAKAQETLIPYELVPYPRVLRAPKGKYTLHGFVRIKRETWPDMELIARIKTLPSDLSVEVDPDSIL